MDATIQCTNKIGSNWLSLRSYDGAVSVSLKRGQTAVVPSAVLESKDFAAALAGGYLISSYTPNEDTGITIDGAHQIVFLDAGKTLWCNSLAPVIVVIASDGVEPIPSPATIGVVWEGVGVVIIVADPAVTLNGVAGGFTTIIKQYDMVMLAKRGIDTWVGLGAINAVT